MLVVTLNSAESQRNRFGLASQPQFRLIYVSTWYFSVLEYYILNVKLFYFKYINYTYLGLIYK